jgi:hypothetical protein
MSLTRGFPTVPISKKNADECGKNDGGEQWLSFLRERDEKGFLVFLCACYFDLSLITEIKTGKT